MIDFYKNEKMPQLEINFMFFRVDHSPLDNDFIFKKRREIAQMFENCGFGEIVENGENKFANTFAIPLLSRVFMVKCNNY